MQKRLCCSSRGFASSLDHLLRCDAADDYCSENAEQNICHVEVYVSVRRDSEHRLKNCAHFFGAAYSSREDQINWNSAVFRECPVWNIQEARAVLAEMTCADRLDGILLHTLATQL